MEQVKGIYKEYYSSCDKLLSQYSQLSKIESTTKVPKVFITLGFSAVVFLFILLNIGSRFIVNFIGFGYSAFASIRAIESPGKDDDTQWLTYWVVYGLLNLVEHFSSFVLYWIPFYYVLKTAFLIWLMLPNTRGAEKLYNSYVKPVYLNMKTSTQEKTK
ncbi:hypothetical protein BB559_002225 [Furculomyces boomerangus]|uniref:Protein YOP1 n=2 Tax=Harpellales TaxID=61421 RepID=A0A2T9YX14_9FUNG|nr:hypothetical protein BB559_002225 [Furculomyces boomerangus]PWA02367.1 hypothetical protein BB558_001492 [Smittium angustum]